MCLCINACLGSVPAIPSKESHAACTQGCAYDDASLPAKSNKRVSVVVGLYVATPSIHVPVSCIFVHMTMLDDVWRVIYASYRLGIVDKDSYHIACSTFGCRVCLCVPVFYKLVPKLILIALLKGLVFAPAFIHIWHICVLIMKSAICTCAHMYAIDGHKHACMHTYTHIYTHALIHT